MSDDTTHGPPPGEEHAGRSATPSAHVPAATDRYVLDRDVLPYLVNRATDLVEEPWRVRENAWRAGLTLLLGLGWLGWNRISPWRPRG